jgi:hypothetical protein
MEKRHRRPFVVTLLAFDVFLLGMGYFLQSGQALSHYSLHQQIALSVPAWYPPLAGGIWGVLWLILAAGLWFLKEWARRLTLIVLPLHLGLWLADWVLFSRSEIAIQSFGFDLILRLIFTGLAAAILLLSGRWNTAEAGVNPDERPSEREIK